MSSSEYMGMSRRGSFVYPEIHVSFVADCPRNSVRPDFSEAALRQYKATGEDLHGIPSLAQQRALESARFDTAGALTTVVGVALVDKAAEANIELARTFLIITKAGTWKE